VNQVKKEGPYTEALITRCGWSASGRGRAILTQSEGSDHQDTNRGICDTRKEKISKKEVVLRNAKVSKRRRRAQPGNTSSSKTEKRSDFFQKVSIRDPVHGRRENACREERLQRKKASGRKIRSTLAGKKRRTVERETRM